MLNNQRLEVSNHPPYDPLQAFMRENHVAMSGLEEGPLAGLTFAIKDAYDILGSTFSIGHPEWARTHEPAEFTASLVTNVLEAGADLVGKTVCDELMFSLSGENWHYGSPINPQDPRRYCGGSSSGTAAAAAGGLVDFAIGTDCLGSIRIPPSYTGIIGIRASIGRIPTDGQAPYSDSLDSSGFVAPDPDLFQKAAKVILGKDQVETNFKKLFLPEDSFNAVGEELKEALKPGIEHIKEHFDEVIYGNISNNQLEQWVKTLQIIQEYEVWESYGGWIRKYRPQLSEGPGSRLERSSRVTLSEYKTALAEREEITQKINEVVDEETVICLPTAASVAPLRTSTEEEINATRLETSELLCLSPLAGIPQMSLPLAEFDQAPLGISLLSMKGSDQNLVKKAMEIMKSFNTD